MRSGSVREVALDEMWCDGLRIETALLRVSAVVTLCATRENWVQGCFGDKKELREEMRSYT